MNSLSIDTLKKALDTFRQEPINRFRVKLMRRQAERLRRIFAKPHSMNLETFLREMQYNDNFSLNINQFSQEFSQLEKDLENGKLPIQGQSFWKIPKNVSSTKKFREVLEILTDDSPEDKIPIPPLYKVLEIHQNKNFSKTLATGLAMIFHPQNFLIDTDSNQEIIWKLEKDYGANQWNSKTIEPFYKEYLGIREDKVLEKFQTIADKLQENIKTEDFIELHAFLNWVYRHLEPGFDEIFASVRAKGLYITKQTLRRYHLSLKTRGFVILSGISGIGKTWLAEVYAQASQGEYLIVPVAPNWSSNEDLLGYFNPISQTYQDTPVSQFMRQALAEYQKKGDLAKTYHLILDEMNLARAEYYLAKFLSAMEIRARNNRAEIELAPAEKFRLPPNLYTIGTVNIDESTHSFADKVYDRAQLIELPVLREELNAYLKEQPYQEVLMQIWDAIHEVAPFAFRVLEEIQIYVEEAKHFEVNWEIALDEQLLQKILPKLKGTDMRIGKALEAFIAIADTHHFSLSLDKAQTIYDHFMQHGIASYF